MQRCQLWVVKFLWLQSSTFVQARMSTKPAQVLSHSMAREEGKGERKKKQRSTFKLNQAEGMSWVCTEMDGSPCNIKAPCLAMPTVPLLSAAPALPASRPSALPSRWHFKAGTQTWQAWLSAWSQPPPSSSSFSPAHHPFYPATPTTTTTSKTQLLPLLGQVSAKIHTARRLGSRCQKTLPHKLN